MKSKTGALFAGLGAGSLNGLFGAGGGMVLVPLMEKLTDLDEPSLFPCSVTILLSICITSLLFCPGWDAFSWIASVPYLAGSFLGGICAGLWGRKIPSLWLHRVLGALILWGGIRYLCSNG